MLDRIAGALLTSETVPLKSMPGLVIPRESYNIDPVAASQAIGGYQKYQQAVNLANEMMTATKARQVDKGSLELDMLLNNLGIRSNLSGVRKKEKPVIVRLDDDASYKIERFKPRGIKFGKTTDIEYITLADTPMMDWDVQGDAYHMDRNASVRHLGDVEELVKDYVSQNPESILRLYRSPGGYRAWELGRQMSAKEFQPSFEQLQVDPDYARLSLSNDLESRGGFASRVSHKPGRTDWVAQPIMTFKGRNAIENPRNAKLVRTLHDEPILKTYMDNQGINETAAKQLLDQRQNVSSALAKEITRRFNR